MLWPRPSSFHKVPSDDGKPLTSAFAVIQSTGSSADGDVFRSESKEHLEMRNPHGNSGKRDQQNKKCRRWLLGKTGNEHLVKIRHSTVRGEMWKMSQK